MPSRFSVSKQSVSNSVQISKLPIKALTRNLSMESRAARYHCPNPTQHERLQRFQGLFEKLRESCHACEKCFVSIIKTCALTRLGFEFGMSTFCTYIQ